jgi:CRISPR-associated protein Cas2
MLYVVCFDIGDDQTRRRVGKYLEAFGNRVQESVFEVEVKDAIAMRYVQTKLATWLAEGDDLRFYPLCKDCQRGSYNAQHERIAKLPALVIV